MAIIGISGKGVGADEFDLRVWALLMCDELDAGGAQTPLTADWRSWVEGARDKYALAHLEQWLPNPEAVRGFVKHAVTLRDRLAAGAGEGEWWTRVRRIEIGPYWAGARELAATAPLAAEIVELLEGRAGEPTGLPPLEELDRTAGEVAENAIRDLASDAAPDSPGD